MSSKIVDILLVSLHPRILPRIFFSAFLHVIFCEVVATIVSCIIFTRCACTVFVIISICRACSLWIVRVVAMARSMGKRIWLWVQIPRSPTPCGSVTTRRRCSVPRQNSITQTQQPTINHLPNKGSMPLLCFSNSHGEFEFSPSLGRIAGNTQ